jgi:hypothetical protein
MGRIRVLDFPDLLSPGQKMRAAYYRTNKMHPFPAGSKGFLYYHPPTSSYHLPRANHFEHGHIRMRLAPGPDPSNFAIGNDLVLPTGGPWFFATGLTYRGGGLKRIVGEDDILLRSIVHDGLATRDDVERWRTPRWEGGVPYSVLDPAQPFLLDFTRWQNFHIVSKGLWKPSFHMKPEEGKNALLWNRGAWCFVNARRGSQAL